MPSDIIAALEPVVAAFEALGVSYRIGGSVASSALGVPRSTLDVDLVCDLRAPHVNRLVTALQDSYYADADMMREAIQSESSFNLVHLATMLKVDVFVHKSTPWDLEALLPEGSTSPGYHRYGSRVRPDHCRGHRSAQACVVPVG